MNRCGLDAISAGSESQNLHTVVRVFLEAVQDSFAGRRDLSILRIFIVPRVRRTIDNLKQIFKDTAAKYLLFLNLVFTNFVASDNTISRAERW